MSILILILPATIGVLYSWIVKKFLKNNFIFFLPSIISILWLIYIFTLYTGKQNEGFGHIALVIYALMVLALIGGNIVSSIYFIIINKKNH